MGFLNIRGWWYRGDQYYCPCCEKRYRTFLTMSDGASNRENVVCPGCAVVERHRLLRLYLKEKTNIYSKPHRVLYFAPELSIQKHLKAQPNIDYLSTDIDSSLAMQEFDIMDIPHPDESFSIIFCSHVLAHVKDDQKALKELLRILKKDGLLIIFDVPAENPKTLEYENVKTAKERLKAYGQADRWRLYGQDFIERIEATGFQIEVDHFANKLSETIIEEYRISKRDKIYLCRRS
jgi:SAM-dependent methyltransferase